MGQSQGYFKRVETDKMNSKEIVNWLSESMQISVKISSGIGWLWVTPKAFSKELKLTKWIQVYSVQIKVDQIFFKNE